MTRKLKTIVVVVTLDEDDADEMEELLREALGDGGIEVHKVERRGATLQEKARFEKSLNPGGMGGK